ncbi:NADP(H)-dependent aldo-keto reductase [Kiloniella laminariae]|uniref:NADP(H)-dependent aldo-keto reductase n=1 Tax=Kiloniella laminariae TaxID=454162 RepID=A0ABT4LKZ4_9PROT|nr:NADP(H)-dependent aldo-keto reductase [Kiloniella laminariae]MCZ4281041.1 NADP(H)-dependent aldo-keto reductase [Kiloniella laminariae]
MDYRKLGRTDLKVSCLCLGTMTWGEQNSQAEAFEQMDYAVDQGINFFDTAEIYAVPPKAETYGATEEIIGNWFQNRKKRDQIVLASKVAGPSPAQTYIRGEIARFNRKHITAALDNSLKRLKTDYIDLYQLHWPDRNVNIFGQLGFDHRNEEMITQPEETLAVLDDLVKAGKIRHVGISNETPWGTMEFLRLAGEGKGPRMVSIQNPYSFLNRSFEVGLAEIAIREDIGLLAYAPLAAGVLTGKYLGGARPEGARISLFPDNKRYMGQRAEAAVQDYVSLADKYRLDPAQMALAYVRSRPFVTAPIIGATKMAQLKTNIASAEITLSDEVLAEIEALGRRHTIPCP